MPNPPDFHFQSTEPMHSNTRTFLLPPAPAVARIAAWSVSGSIIVVDLLVAVLLSIVLVSILLSVLVT